MKEREGEEGNLEMEKEDEDGEEKMRHTEREEGGKGGK